MTIWRGEGGGGDATTDSEINFITSLTNSIVDNTAITTAAADATAALYDSFDDRYLGSKAAAPTLDNDGNVLLSGALYWNSVSNQMFVWSGVAWQQTFFSGTNVRSVVTATAGQTVVTTPAYTLSNNTIQVYVNGFKVISGTDYSETNTTSITFASGLTLGDEIEIIIAQPFSVGTTSADVVNYLPSGTGAVATTVQTKLRESVSILDFGADSTGVADSAAAIQAAIDAVYAAGGGQVYLPAGTYKVTAPIYPKFAVALVGPDTYLGVGQIYNGAATEAKIAGVAVLQPTAAVTTACVYYDFQMATLGARPYGATLENIVIDSRNQGGGDCLYIRPTLASQGPFSSGFASDSLAFKNCVFRKAPRCGAYIVSTATEKINADFYDCRFALNGSHGIYGYLCFDLKVYNCFSFANTGDGMRLEGCATERVIESDFFNNSGAGITLDGYDGRYLNCAVENNQLHGVNIICSVSTIINKRYRFTDCRFGTNGFAADNTYDNVSVGSYGGLGISGVSFVGCSFGAQAHVGTSNRVRAEIYSAVLPAQIGNNMTGCVLAENDLKTGNALCNSVWLQSTTFSSTNSSDGNQLTTNPVTLPAWTGLVSPNVLLGATFYKTANVAAATLFGVSTGTAAQSLGRELWILINDANTTVKFTAGGNLTGNGGVNLAAPCSGKLLHLKCIDGTNWATVIHG